MTTEQEFGRGAPVRRAVPKTGTRRSGAQHQSKPRPRPDARPHAGGARPVTGRARPETGPVPRPRPARRQRAPFVLLVVGLLCGGLVSLLLLNTMLAKDAITDANLREEIAVARQENEKINQEYQRKTQPDVIAEMAEKQGQHPDWDNPNAWTSAGERASRVDRER
ncbi:hypothetical protein FE391_28305 [Nonomuraea sp. KC401]|uniref:Septum formation initiator family protein n=1 Tax=Nonomuraea longispora TaxID=1848320 RepID=A0A4R4NKC7_9ACTN|nr:MULTISPECIES: hypothetical protein [Nonomuraea]NBE97691.1 hypothetical protein [Nonomuraea sp. K271]TDC09595.1 hypothetical protein E1267_07095 [Nonomuraea longispora]TLF63915.1 hypothetical protein FE391_28305 [Nonomuraea sp. KC401]